MSTNNHCPLITKYRPISFDEVIGNQLTIQALKEAIHSESKPHCFLFTGGTGIGKTTLARIIASEVNAFIVEINAAVENSVESTRRLTELFSFRPIMTQPCSMCIIDEAHSLSRQAWSPLLKLTEEPPSFLYIALCTTEPQKVPDTIKSRAYPVTLKMLKPQEIEELLEVVIQVEGWKVENSVFQGIVQASEGSARKALSILQAGHALKNRDELSQIILTVESEDNPAIKLAQALLKGNRNWRAISQLIKEIEGGSEEDTIFTITRYLASKLPISEEEQAQHIYRLLRSFTDTNSWDHKVQFYTAIGKCLWGQLPF
jgi:DNA polymerase-3 subunit gamma/tau